LKILYLSTLYTPNLVGGAERVVQSLAEDMVAAGHEAVVLSTTSQESTVNRVNGVKIYYIHLKNVYWPYGEKVNPAPIKALWHALDTYNPCPYTPHHGFFLLDLARSRSAGVAFGAHLARLLSALSQIYDVSRWKQLRGAVCAVSAICPT
jgi:glycosyltransferase involved in cell wall biosynthesis